MFSSSKGSAAVAGLAVAAAVLVAGFIFSGSGRTHAIAHASTTGHSPPIASALDVTITPESKLGSDGKRHDAYSQTEFDVRAGRPLTLRIDNTDNQPHSIVSATARVAIIAAPGVHDYTLLVKHVGRFHWRCFFNCDSGANGWAMTHVGYMSGYITAT